MASQEQKISSVARNYADALVELVKDKGTSFEQMDSELDVVSEALINSADLSAVMYNPSINIDVKKDIVTSVFKEKISSDLVNFLNILIEKGRIDEIPQICSQFKIKMNELNNVQPVTVVSAVELSLEQKSNIVSKLSEKLKKTILPEWQIDESIIAGITIKIYDNVIDMSVKHRIETLNKSLLLNNK